MSYTGVYTVKIKWVAAMADGFWEWTAYKFPTDDPLETGTSYFRWTGLWAARRWCKKYEKGKIKPVDNGARTKYYKV